MIRAALICLALPVSAQAAGFTPPQGCTTKMTVQSKQCRVSNYYTCGNDPAGTSWRVDSDQEGPFFATLTNAEGEWLESLDANGRRIMGERADPASISTLFAEGRDEYDFWLNHEQGTRTHVTGRDVLTGRAVTIDGQVLQQTKFAFTEMDETGRVLRHSHGNEFVSQDLGSFFAGPSEHDDGSGNALAVDGSPMSFAFPGEDGFEAGQPIFDCDAVIS
ncbi:hypothetical protein [Falsirhodobacter deserti]|uniref:hypothetical protein n=1 Tax=Falsirhodobacter deserti TaxID=1365611 RepID=UPI000FE4261E|nr:hypothetical protein [Falsirhodobacter deserti]